MAVIHREKLARLEADIQGWKARGKIPHGYPIALVTDLIDTIRHIATEKKKWKAVAEKRAAALVAIQAEIEKAVARI